MIMRMTDVCSELGVSRASIYRLLQSTLSKTIEARQASHWLGT